MKLGDIVSVTPGYDSSADFFIETDSGIPLRECKQIDKVISIQVVHTDVLVPEFLFYWMVFAQKQGMWHQMQVTAANIRNIPTAPMGEVQ